MTIKDIIYLKSVTPITLEENPSPKTIELVAHFLADFLSSEFFITNRKLFKLPEKGIDITPFIGKNFLDPSYADVNPFYGVIQLVASSLKGTLGLDDDMVDQMVLLIFFNACIDLRYFKGFISQPIQFIIGRKNIASTIVDYPKEVGALLVPFSVSQTTLIKWIKANWETIDKQINDNLTNNPYVLKVHKNTELMTEIIDLKDNKRKTFSAIASLLTDKYPDNKLVMSEEWIKRMYYYYKKILRSQPQPPKAE